IAREGLFQVCSEICVQKSPQMRRLELRKRFERLFLVQASKLKVATLLNGELVFQLKSFSFTGIPAQHAALLAAVHRVALSEKARNHAGDILIICSQNPQLACNRTLIMKSS